MMSRAILVGMVLILAPTPGSASEWALSLFDSLDHDFGKVSRGTELTHQFTITNNTGKDVRIKDVRVSCHCTKASVAERKLEPGQSTQVVAVMETAGFQGSKSVSIFVQFDKPRRKEAALRISCVSQGNIATSVNEVDFGVVAAGAGAKKKLQLSHPGDGNWRITAVDYGNPYLQAEAVETGRTASDVHYELHISLSKEAPAGKLEDRVRLHTNDANAPQVLVDIHAKVDGVLEIAPKTLSIKGQAPGSAITKSFVIKGQQPFRIVGVGDTAQGVQVRCGQTAQTTQLLVVTMTVPADGAALPEEIELLTDLEGDKTLVIPIER